VKISKNDTVLVVTGKDKGKKGKVRRVFLDKQRLLIDGVNMNKKHSKARAAARQAGIIEMESPIHVSNVMLVCNKCDRPVRVGFRVLEGKKLRICSSCHEVID